MKSFICIALIAIAASIAVANPAANKPAEDSEVQASAQVQAAAADLTRLRKSAYGGSSGGSASIPAPPCPKNYLFSCQPNLAPVPCSSPAASSYGSQQGAYSAPVPTYIAPIRGNYGYPQAYARSFVPQALHYNQYYQY